MIKRGFSVFLAAVMVLSFSACGPKRESARSVAEHALAAVKDLDMQAVQQYWGDESTILSDTAISEPSVEIMELLTKNFSYSITDSREDEDAGTATVSVDMTNTDMSLIIAGFLAAILSDMLSNAFLPVDQQPSDEDLTKAYLNELAELMAGEDLDTVTNSVDIHLTLTDDQWKIVPSDEVFDAMFGGMLSAFTSLDNQSPAPAE